jgi:hypothetical protein
MRDLMIKYRQSAPIVQGSFDVPKQANVDSVVLA